MICNERLRFHERLELVLGFGLGLELGLGLGLLALCKSCTDICSVNSGLAGLVVVGGYIHDGRWKRQNGIIREKVRLGTSVG